MKNQKGITPIIVLIILVVIAAGGILVWQFWPTEELVVTPSLTPDSFPSPAPNSSPAPAPAPTPITEPEFQILEHLKTDTQLPFSEIRATTFNWRQRIKEDSWETEALIISGYKIDFIDGSIAMEKEDGKVHYFLRDNNFVVADYNTADGGEYNASIMGYQRSSLVCIIDIRDQENQEDQRKMEVKCGLLVD